MKDLDFHSAGATTLLQPNPSRVKITQNIAGGAHGAPGLTGHRGSRGLPDGWAFCLGHAPWLSGVWNVCVS